MDLRVLWLVGAVFVLWLIWRTMREGRLAYAQMQQRLGRERQERLAPKIVFPPTVELEKDKHQEMSATLSHPRMEIPSGVTRQLIPHNCPSCKYESDSETVAGNMDSLRATEPGDFTICINCGYVERYDSNMIRRKVVIAEIGARPIKEQITIYAAVLAIVQRGRLE
jgi:hypothetical protein